MENRLTRKKTKIIEVQRVSFGGDIKPIIAGPCAVEDEEIYLESIKECKKIGASLIRGNIFKPRTSPHSFQGIGIEGINVLKQAKKMIDLPIVMEILDYQRLDDVYDVIDMIQIGARNMQNFSLLKEVGKTKKPILLKRGLASTIEEWLLAAEHIIAAGNENIVLCERGIRTFEPSIRFSLDITSVPVVKEFSNFPIVIDPSHSAGDPRYIKALCKAGLAVGADGLMVEVHSNPEKALCDGKQALTIDGFKEIVAELEQMNFRIR